MKKKYCLLLFILCTVCAFAQTNVLTKEGNQPVNQIELLADDNYNFEQLLKDSTLIFIQNPLLNNFTKNKTYWVKFDIENKFDRPQEYYLSVFPFIDNTLYYYDSEKNKWETARAGLAKSNGTRSHSFFPVTVFNNKKNIFYVQISTKKLANFKDSTHVHIALTKAAIVKQNEQRSLIIWIITLVIILILFLYNLYSYYIFKDKAFLYYLIILTGAAIYITCINKYYNYLFSYRYFQVLLSKEGYTYFYDINAFLTDISIVIIITGYIQFARNYLQTKVIFPKWDRGLKYIARVFVAASLFSAITTISGVWFNHIGFAFIQNCVTIAIILLIIFVSIIAYRLKYMFGKYFLLANILPFLLMLLVAIYFIINPTANDGGKLLPNLAILSLAITFAIALFFRINTLKKDLGNEQLQAQILVNNLNKSEQGNSEKEIILKEIHHRVKNNLQIINGLLFMQFKDNNDEKMKAQLKQSQERIKSMALVHNKLYETDSTVHVYIKEYIKDLAGDILKTNTPTGKSIQLNIEENEAVNLSLYTSVSLGLILNELITNACKYAFTDKENGHINIQINKQASGGYQLIVKDDGSGLAENFHQKNSMGLRLVTNLSKQLGGQAKFENNSGTVVIVDFVDRAAA